MSAASFLKRPGRSSRLVSDIQPGTPEQTGIGITECLRVKGFCVVADFVPPEVLEGAQLALPDVKGWVQPATLVQQGLLGEEGSFRIAPLPMTELGALPTEGLGGIDSIMWRLSEAVIPFQEDLGFRCGNRSETLLHEARLPDTDEVDLTDKEADKWCSVFMCRKVIMLVFLGPGKGSLEMQPYEEDTDPAVVKTEPGLVVVVRTDQLSFRYFSKGLDASYVASCSLQQNDILRMHRSRIEEHMVPAAMDIDAFIHSRLREIKDAEPEEPDWIDLGGAPANWVHAANRLYFKQQVIEVRSAACRLPQSWVAESFFITSLIMGLDSVITVPYQRWDIRECYSEEPAFVEAAPKTDCRHGAFVDGLELFDHRMFSISHNEVRDMDPGQRVTLEVTYESLLSTGWRGQAHSPGLACGMFLGHGTSEWQYADREAAITATSATGGAASIAAGRLSFALGCKGPSVAVDTDQASSLTAVWWACESIQKKGKGHTQELACGIGVHLVLAKIVWLARSQRGDFSKIGRCRTFDSGADGFVVADGVGSVVLKTRSETIDGEEVRDESGSPLGSIVGGATNNSGRGSALSAPHGSSMQEVVIDALVASSIMPSDVDVIECHSTGKTSGDYIEAIAAGSALRNWQPEEQGPEGVLCLGSSKTNTGNSIETAGLSSLMKIIYSISWGAVMANLHLRQLNRHLDLSDRRCETLTFASELMEQGQGSLYGKVFVGVTAFGWGGTNVHLQCFGGVDEGLREPPGPMPEELKPRLAYWPGGGGDLDGNSRPRKGYFITGTFNRWAEGVPMRFSGEGCHDCVLTLGENRWEQFQILIDNDPAKVLHPRMYKAPRGTQVFGPEQLDTRESTWLLDGREQHFKNAQGEGFEYRPSGLPGDRYSVRLHVAGKWRTVSWTKLETPALTAQAGEGLLLADVATYSVRGSWDDYTDRRMRPHPSAPGLFFAEVTLYDRTGYFVIVRNEDWSQAIYPSRPAASAGCAPILGPDDSSQELEWCIRGRAGDAFRIDFQRTVQDGKDRMHIEWHRI